MNKHTHRYIYIYINIPGPSRGVQWRSLSSVGAFIGDPFEGAGIYIYIYISQTLHGTGIYAAPLTPLAPPQLIGIYGIHGVSGYIYIYIPAPPSLGSH